MPNKLFKTILTKQMLYRKYLSFYRCTFPCIWVVVSAWFIDRLLMELGHRSSTADVCTHSNLQYVIVHKWLTSIACAIQSYYSIRERTTQFERERALMGIEVRICHYHIQLLQAMLCVSWLVLVAALVDVSPWLCIEHVAQYRASYAFIAFISMFIIIPLESYLWDKSLNLALVRTSAPIHI